MKSVESNGRLRALIDLFKAGIGKLKSNTVILNGSLVNVFTEEVYPSNVAIYGSKIAAVGEVNQCIGKNTNIINAKNSLLVPGLIDGHIHFEMTKIPITRFAEAVLPSGTTAIMTSLDHTYAVAGLEGMRAMLDEAKKTPLKVFHIPPVTFPASLPRSTSREFGFKEAEKAIEWAENTGFVLENEDFLKVLDQATLKVIDFAYSEGLLVHGCSPRISGGELCSHLSTGMRSDHEMISAEETLERLRYGVYSLIREAPMAHNLIENIRAITENSISSRRACLVGDDWESRDLIELGHVDHMVRLAIKEGVDPIKAIQMATLNTAEAYRVDHLLGNICPGKYGDIVIIDDLNDFRVQKVVANGELIAENGKMLKRFQSFPVKDFFRDTFDVKMPVRPNDVEVKTEKDATEVEVVTIDNSGEKGEKIKKNAVLKVEDGIVKPDIEKDVVYVTVVERHFGTGNKATAFITGYGLKSGAFATSYHPDDSNILVMGTNAKDIAYAVNYVARVGGAQVVVDKQEVLEIIHLPIGGIQADVSALEMAAGEIKLEKALKKLGCKIDRPFARMQFIPLTMMPYIALTDKGLVDWETTQYINPIRKIVK